VSRTIALPQGTDIRLSIRPPYHLVVVAPSPLTANLDDLLSKPRVIGMFTFDPGVTWPDRSGCAYASVYLAAGHPICLQFDELTDALACRERLAKQAAA